MNTNPVVSGPADNHGHDSNPPTTGAEVSPSAGLPNQSDGQRSGEFPEALQDFRKSQVSDDLETTFRGWVSRQCTLFNPFPAILILVPSSSGMEVAAYTGGVLMSSERMAIFCDDFAAKLSVLMKQEPDRVVDKGDDHKHLVFRDLGEFRSWAGIAAPDFVGGEVLVRIGRLQGDHTVNVVILAEGGTFDLSRRATLETIAASSSSDINRIYSIYHREEGGPVEPRATGTRKEKRARAPSNEATNIEDKVVLTTSEAAQLAGVSRYTIIKDFDSGVLSGFRVPGSKVRRIPRTDLERYRVKKSEPA